jgi:hypothetical protein
MTFQGTQEKTEAGVEDDGNGSGVFWGRKEKASTQAGGGIAGRRNRTETKSAMLRVTGF